MNEQYPSDEVHTSQRQDLYDRISQEFQHSSFGEQYSTPLLNTVLGIVRDGSLQDATDATEVLLDDSLRGNKLPRLMGKSSFVDVYDKKSQFLGIMQASPDTALAIAAQNIAGFHGSNSSSLLGVLDHGLLSSGYAREQGLPLGSGERTYSKPGARGFISFSDWREPRELSEYVHCSGTVTPSYLKSQLDTVLESARTSREMYGDDHPFTYNGYKVAEDITRVIEQIDREPDGLYAALVGLNFPVAYGIDISDYTVYDSSVQVTKQQGKIIAAIMARSHIRSEFGVINDVVPVDDIPVIAVPRAHMPLVSAIVSDKKVGMDVVPIELILNTYY